MSTNRAVPKAKVIKAAKKTKYEPWMCQEIVKVAEEGGHVAQMCLAIGIRSRDTFYEWLKKYEDFKQAYEASKLVSQAFFESILLAGAIGKIKNFNFNALAMTLNNKFPGEYTRGTGAASTQVTIGSINSIEKMDTTALDKKIKALLGDLGGEDERTDKGT